jgi:hypothetical protein
MDLERGQYLMSRSGESVAEFGGEERTFRLGIKQWEKVQETCDAGPGEILARLAPAFLARQQGLSFEQIIQHGMLGSWRVHDVREPILQGLLGAGMPGPEALKLVRDWIDERDLIESLPVAYKVVFGGIVGAGDEAAVGEAPAVAEVSPNSPAASSGSEKTGSTRSAARSAGRRRRSAT